MIQVTHIESTDGEWEAIYLDGVKLDENHSIDFPSFLRKLGSMGLLTFQEVDINPQQDEEGFWTTEGAFPYYLPQDLTTLPGFSFLS